MSRSELIRIDKHAKEQLRQLSQLFEIPITKTTSIANQIIPKVIRSDMIKQRGTNKKKLRIYFVQEFDVT